MTANEALALSGTLGSSALLDALRRIASQHTYCTIQVANGALTREIHLANGEILISNAADPAKRQQEIDAVFEIIRNSLSGTGAFRLVPLSNVPNADSSPRIQVEAAIMTATRLPAAPMPSAAPAPVAPAPAAGTPASAAPAVSAPAPTAGDAPVAPTPLTPPTAETSAAPEEPSRRVRASQLRQILRDGGSLNDHLPGAPTERSGSTSRSSALRELIGQLAND